MRAFVGIDPGKKGAAVAIDDDGRVLAMLRFADIVGDHDWRDVAPTLCDALCDILRHYGQDVPADHQWETEMVCMERDAGRPKEGAGSARTTGRGWGLVLGIIVARGYPYIVPTAQSVAKVMHKDVPGDDPKARSIAIATQAGVPLTRGRERKPQEGIADAYVLALYARREWGARR